MNFKPSEARDVAQYEAMFADTLQKMRELEALPNEDPVPCWFMGSVPAHQHEDYCMCGGAGFFTKQEAMAYVEHDLECLVK